MTNNFLRKSLLSVVASTLLVSGLSATNAITSASIDLEEYNMTKIVFDTIDAATLVLVKQDINDGNITIENDTTDDNISLTYEFNTSTEVYVSISDADDIDVIRGNTQNLLTLNVVDTVWDDSDTGADFNLTTTIGTLVVVDDVWNLVTMPSGVYTNAKEVIKSGKATMIWGWEYNSSSEYNWVSYPEKMEAGRGYWIRTRITANTDASLGDVVASDYNLTLLSDVDSTEINTSNFADIISNIPVKDEWVLLGNSGNAATIISTSSSEDNSSTYFFEDLLDSGENCYFVSIYDWNATSSTWVNDTEGGAGTVPANAGVWAKQRLCDNDSSN